MRAEYAGSIRDEAQVSRMESEVFSLPKEGEFAEHLWVEFLTTHPHLTEIISEEQGVITRRSTVTLEQALERTDMVRYDGADVTLSKVADHICARAYQSAKLAATVAGMMMHEETNTQELDLAA